jgi:hypothetical protein
MTCVQCAPNIDRCDRLRRERYCEGHVNSRTDRAWEDHVATRTMTRSISVTGGYPQALAFSDDGQMAVGLSRHGTLIFPRVLPGGAGQPTARFTAVPGRDATFRLSLPSGRIESSGKDNARYLSCRVGRMILPPERCQTTTR